MAHVRSMQVGDLGWSFMRQAELYAAEFGYSQVFETYVARGLAPFLDHFDPAKDGMWVAEATLPLRPGPPQPVSAAGVLGGPVRVGCIALQHDPEQPGWAKLRWYFVEAAARGTGTGSALLATALAFARKARYAGVYLWTVNDLDAARRQYEKAGFRLAFEDPAPCPWAPWGHEQRWELQLAGPAAHSQR